MGRRDQGQLHRRHRRSAFPICCGRRSAPPPAARPGRCISNCAATPARCWTTRPISISSFEKRFAQYPAFRPEAEPDAVKAAVDALKRAAKPIIVVGGGAVASGAGAELLKLAETLQIPIATSLHAKSARPGQSSAGRRRAGQLLALVREPGRGGGRPRLLHRQPHRRPGDERLADSEDRHARRYSSTSTRTSWGATTRTRSRCTATRR